MTSLRMDHNPQDLRHFTDSSKLSGKWKLAVFLHSGKSLPSVPVAHAVHIKLSWDNVIASWKIKYEDHQWQICDDMKVIVTLLGTQFGFTKCCRFVCEWDSCDRSSHYIRKMCIRDRYNRGLGRELTLITIDIWKITGCSPDNVWSINTLCLFLSVIKYVLKVYLLKRILCGLAHN